MFTRTTIDVKSLLIGVLATLLFVAVLGNTPAPQGNTGVAEYIILQGWAVETAGDLDSNYQKGLWGQSLAWQVKLKLAEGFQPIGGIAYSDTLMDGTPHYTQAMVRYK